MTNFLEKAYILKIFIKYFINYFVKMSKTMFLSQNIIKLDDYKITKYLGQGGFGIVFEAIEKKTGKLVALKVLKEKKLLHRKKNQQSSDFPSTDS